MSGGSKTTTSQQNQTATNTLDPQYKAAIMGNVADAQTRAASLLPYSGQLTAGFTPTQIAAQGRVTDIANDGSYKAANNNAIGAISGVVNNPLGGGITARPVGTSPVAPSRVATSPVMAGTVAASPVKAGTMQGNSITVGSVSPSLLANTDLASYMNPYTDKVINSTIADQERARQMQSASDNRQMAAQGAFGGSRSGVAQAQTNEAYDRNTASLIARLNSDNFNQARGAATTDIANRMAGDEFNVGNRLTADTFNANQKFNADQINVANSLNADQFNSGQSLTADQYNVGNRLAADQFSAGQSLTAGQFNATNALNADQFNAGQALTAGEFNSGQDMTAQQDSFANALAGRNQTLDASNRLLAANGAALNTAGQQASLLSGVGDAQQAQQQAEFDAAYQAYMSGQQLTVTQQQMIDAALGLVPAQQSVTTTGSGTETAKTNGGLTGMLSGLGSLGMGLGAMGVTM